MPFNLFTICGVIYLVLIFVVFLLDVSLPCIHICSVIYLILIFTVSVLSLCLIQYLLCLQKLQYLLLSILKLSNHTQYSLPPATKLGQGNVFTGMCDSVHRGVCLSACWDVTPPGAGTPIPPEQTPPEQAPPQEQTPPPGADTPPRVDPPGASTPLETAPPQEQTPLPSRHPLGAGTPPEQSMLGDTVNARVVRILLACNLVSLAFMFFVSLKYSYYLCLMYHEGILSSV